jgi:hypothetical protein
MPFKIRDLMIDVATPDSCGFTYFTWCRLPSRLPPCFAYTCGYSWTPMELRQDERPTGPGPVELGSLKEQLRAQLAQIEAHERAAEAAARPQTREQAAELEEKLRGALEEVRGWQETLPSGGTK